MSRQYLFLFLVFFCELWNSLLVSAGLEQRPLLSLPYESVYLRYAAFGDSWASGINYGPPSATVEYDFEVFEEVCRCRRVNEAYPVQLHDEPFRRWTQGRIPDLDFQACHGAFFDAIPDQVARLNQTYAPELATLMIGGNNGCFPDIIENCIFQFNNGKDYGPEYPNPEGECAKALQRANEHVRADWFKHGIRDSINAILREPRIQKNRNFKLYVIGYAGMFNHDDHTCNNQTFGVLPGKQPHLTRELRRAINELIDTGRQLYDWYINQEFRNPNIKFIDINPAFGGHRFCEPTPDGSQQAQVDNSWLWSLTWPDCIPLDAKARLRGWPGVAGGRHEIDTCGFCRKCGDWAQLGEVQRPFHPKPEGHKAIKDLLLKVLTDDA